MAGETTQALAVAQPDPVRLDSAFETAASKLNELPWMKTLQLDIASLETFKGMELAAADNYELCNVYNMVADGTEATTQTNLEATPESLMMQQQMPQLNIA